MEKIRLENVKILIADHDKYVGQIVRHNLRALGFTSVHHVRTSVEAMIYLRKNPVDILITEWHLAPMDGVAMIRELRLAEDSPNRGVSIIMMTGRGEMMDVEVARDIGVNEFLVKPFTVISLYKRLERLIDRPKSFVLSKDYAGPDRRWRKIRDYDMENRRAREPMVIPRRTGSALPVPSESPVILPANYYLKESIGMRGQLASVVTSEKLQAAQLIIDKMQEQSQIWIREDLIQLDNAIAQKDLSAMQDIALSIKSRAGIFGHVLLSEIARLLYILLRGIFDIDSNEHWAFVSQSVQLMQIVFAQEIKQLDGLGDELMKDLQAMMAQL
jgi:two-component system chemotaxis response regulator CheY